MKIALNYFQVNSIISNLNIEWPYNVQQYLSTFSSAIDFTGQILSFDCIFYDLGITYSSIYVRTIVSAIIPFIICTLTLVVYEIKKHVFHNGKIRKVYIAFVAAHIVTQPMLLKQLLENFNCLTLDGQRYLIFQMDLKCDDEYFQNWVLISSLFLWEKTNIFYFL